MLQLKDDEGKPRLIEEWIPTSRGSKLKPGIKLPPPYGPEWEEMVKKRGEKWESKINTWTMQQFAHVKRQYTSRQTHMGVWVHIT